ncbi:hypothetical protein RRF57_007112 [Xylaria bambusicola]|uniref:Uncharacterized protein n=1 Tax=Xylaria bambusicola TaxID=326684 RepID=A0AAN7URH3_9PEZI
MCHGCKMHDAPAPTRRLATETIALHGDGINGSRPSTGSGIFRDRKHARSPYLTSLSVMPEPEAGVKARNTAILVLTDIMMRCLMP